jgi:outer membrane protein assembly factor BamB
MAGKLSSVLLIPHLALAATVGSLEWQFTPAHDYQYFDSAPALSHDGTIYVGNQNGHLYAFSSGGKMKWSLNLRGGVHTAPSIAQDGTIYVGSWNGGLTAVSPKGKVKWKLAESVLDNSGISIGPAGTVYFLSDWGNQELIAVNPNGTRQWTFPLKAPQDRCKPVLTTNRIFVRRFSDTFENVQLLALDHSGKLVWSKEAIATDVAVGRDGTLYGGATNSTLVALRPTGETLWQTKIIGGVSSPLIIDRHDTIYCGTSDGYVCAVGAAGKINWIAETSGTVGYCGNMSERELQVLRAKRMERRRPEHPSIRFSPAIDDQGNVIVAAGAGITAFSKDGKKLWEFDVEGTAGGAPVIGASGTIYVGTHGRNLEGSLFALRGAAKLQQSPWPMFGRDPQHSSFAE